MNSPLSSWKSVETDSLRQQSEGLPRTEQGIYPRETSGQVIVMEEFGHWKTRFLSDGKVQFMLIR